MFPGIVTSFDVCSAGSKPETNYPEIGPKQPYTVYCPSLKAISEAQKSLVPEGRKNSHSRTRNDGLNVDAV
jgi:formylmethanofuran--tetrahydromethanopterin N-formyltransferase